MNMTGESIRPIVMRYSVLHIIFIFKTEINACRTIRLWARQRVFFYRNYCVNNVQVLVDPCGGRGWKWMEGTQWNMVSYGESKRFPGVKYYVCRLVPIQIQFIILILQS